VLSSEYIGVQLLSRLASVITIVFQQSHVEEHFHRTNIGAAGKFGRVALWATKIALAQNFVATGASILLGVHADQYRPVAQTFHRRG
jgi:hypothetical protein